MTALRRIAVLAVFFLLATVLAWQTIATGLADHFAEADPERALKWEAHNPTALLALAQRHLARHEPDAAAAAARELLRYEPLEGEAFALLAEAAEAAGEAGKIKILNQVALTRAPRDLHARARLINEQLREGRFSEALQQISLLLQIAPGQSATLFPAMVQLAGVPGFGAALAHALNQAPPWRSGMLLALLGSGTHEAIGAVYQELQHEHGLSSDEFSGWLDQLMRVGRWDEAYSRWASDLPLGPDSSLPLLYNGRFATEPSSSGFDWRIGRTAGITMEREAFDAAGETFAMKLSFSGRRVSDIDFEQRLFLAPGADHLRFRARADNLRSDKGLQWLIACDAQAAFLAASSLMNGKFDWKVIDTEFVIPEDKCPGQRLWLRNQGADAAGKAVSGDIWFRDFAIDRGATRSSL